MYYTAGTGLQITVDGRPVIVIIVREGVQFWSTQTSLKVEEATDDRCCLSVYTGLSFTQYKMCKPIDAQYLIHLLSKFSARDFC